jgi:CheY-like chemotaxis protein
LVEDDAIVADSTCLLIETMGHEVRSAATGAEALDVARSFCPEVVLCDIGLPDGMDGYAVARAFRQDPDLATVYLVALSGYGHKEAIEESRCAGFDLHLTKPVDADGLERLLSQIE